MIRRKRAFKKRTLHINLTPLIDILFLLIIFFVTSSTFQKEFLLKVNLPAVRKGKSSQESGTQVVLVKSRDEIFIENEKVAFKELVLKIPDLLDAKKVVELRVDNDVAYGDAVKIMNEIKNAGFANLALVVVKNQ